MSSAGISGDISRRPDPLALAAKARGFLGEGRRGAARPLVRALRPAGAAPEIAAELEARLLAADGEIPEAVSVLEAAMVDCQRSPSLHLLRAELRLQAGDAVAAALEAADLVIADPSDADAKEFLGRTLLQLGRPSEATRCLGEVLRVRPDSESLRLSLAYALASAGEPEGADEVLADGIALNPPSSALRSAAMSHRLHARDWESVVAMAASARKHAALDAAGWASLGHALRSLGRQGDAADAYATAAKLAPEDPCFRHLAASAGRGTAAERAPPEYVLALFEGHPGFSDQQRGRFGECVPDVMRAMRAWVRPGAGPTLDLGCGTGLLALACADMQLPHWIGVDLSRRMVAQARATSLYEELHETDLLSFLVADTREFPTICASDVLSYFGPLDLVLRAARERMTWGSRLIFTFERLASDRDEVRLASTGRYAHTEKHVAATAASAGLAILAFESGGLGATGTAGTSTVVATLERAA